MKTKNLIYLSLLLFFSSCFLIRNDCNFRSSKTFNFKILNKNVLKLDPTVLKTDGVYISTWVNHQGNKRYNFYRFFENGRVFYSKYKTQFPSKEEFNDIYCGSYGHFIIKNDTIVIETHNASAGYVFHYYKSNGSDIKIIGSRKRKLSKTNYTPNSSGVKYEYHNVDFVTTEANW